MYFIFVVITDDQTLNLCMLMTIVTGRGYLGGGGRGSYRDSGRGRGGFSRDDDRGFSSGRGGRGGMRGGRGSSPRGGFRDGSSRFRDDGRGPPRERSRDTRDSFRSSYSGATAVIKIEYVFCYSFSFLNEIVNQLNFVLLIGRDMGGYSNGSSSFRDSGFSSREGPRDYSDRGGDRLVLSIGRNKYILILSLNFYRWFLRAIGVYNFHDIFVSNM